MVIHLKTPKISLKLVSSYISLEPHVRVILLVQVYTARVLMCFIFHEGRIIIM